MTVTFACGHTTILDDTRATDDAAICGCGERRVTHVAARAPRFRGSCTGPYAEACSLEARPVDLTGPAGPLRLDHPKEA